MLDLSTPVQYIKGIGPRLAEVLAGKGLHTAGDLLHYLPFRYEDRLNPRGVAELRPGFEILDGDDMRRLVRRTMKAMNLASDGEGRSGRFAVQELWRSGDHACAGPAPCDVAGRGHAED